MRSHPTHEPAPRSGPRRRLPSLLLAAACGLAGAAPSVRAQQIPADERSQAVAQTVYGILSFTRWPAEPETVRLCVVGPTEYADELLKAAPPPRGRAIAVRRMRLDDSQLPTECEAVYAGALSDAAWRQLASRLGAHPLLSIGERLELCSIGCMFCLDVRAGGVGFESNLDSVARSGVRVNPRVLQLSRRRGAP
ncbi:MAG: YfiR family protein [Xylophilus ampelinus]